MLLPDKTILRLLQNGRTDTQSAGAAANAAEERLSIFAASCFSRARDGGIRRSVLSAFTSLIPIAR
jgi:hypothetical protein